MKKWMPQRVRVAALVAIVGIVGTMITATQLTPSVAGLGTHHQLGLPPCTFRVIWQIRCPVCGMTTSWAHFVRGEWWSSIRVNSGGFLLALYCVGILPTCIGMVRTARLPNPTTVRYATLALAAVAAVTLTDWVFRLTS